MKNIFEKINFKQPKYPRSMTVISFDTEQQAIAAYNLVIEMVELWLNTEFEGGRHQTRIDMIED
jgi:hypothetical protein